MCARYPWFPNKSSLSQETIYLKLKYFILVELLKIHALNIISGYEFHIIAMATPQLFIK